MAGKVHVIPHDDLIALHQIASTVRVLSDILAGTSKDVTLSNRALFEMVGSMATRLEIITKHINNGDY
mgnify:CR=1 FL=1